MNQIDVLIVLIGLRDDLINLFQDIQIGFDPRVLGFEYRALLALLQDPAHECDDVLHLFGREPLDKKLLYVKLLGIYGPVIGDCEEAKELAEFDQVLFDEAHTLLGPLTEDLVQHILINQHALAEKVHDH